MPGGHLERWYDIVMTKGLDLTQCVNRVSAKEIKAITGIEPRNMAYIDSEDALPSIFASNGVFPLPVTNGEYVIAKGRGFHQIESGNDEVTFRARLPFPFVTLKGRQGEAQQLDYAYNSGLLSRFTGVSDMFLTIRGRQYAPEFRFHIGGCEEITVKGVQIEVDGGYEALNAILLFEAKIGSPASFVIRQLYYPYRTWAQRATGKAVRAFFMTSLPDARAIRLWEYEFADPGDYESIRLVKRQGYRIVELPLRVDAFRNTPTERSRSRIVPQADDVLKLLEFPFRVAEGLNEARSIAAHFRFDRRQSSYYREAAEALDLIELRNHRYELTEVGREYVKLSPDKRNQMFLRLMLSLPIINEVFLAVVQAGKEGVGLSQIGKVIRSKSHLTGSTPLRRAQTVLAWYRWVETALGFVRVSRGRIYTRGADWF